MRQAAIAAALLALPACGGSDDLSRGAVTSIPPGNAVGTSLSGKYRVEIYTRSCSGDCPVFNVLGFAWSVCRVGQKDTETVTVTQTDGRLQVDGDSSLYVTRMTGGINLDGTYDIGGYGTQAGTAIEITERVWGSISPTGAFAGAAKARGYGSYQGTSVNCFASYDLSGKKQ